MQEALSAALMLIGASFILIAGIGLVRMPDLFMCMSSNTKAATLGLGFLLFAVIVYFNEIGITSRVLATIAFLFLTGSVAAHMIGRAAYFLGVPLWEGRLLTSCVVATADAPTCLSVDHLDLLTLWKSKAPIPKL